MDKHYTFGEGTMKQVGDFIMNSQKMYEKIVERMSEIKVVDGMQSLASTYCMELMMTTPGYLQENLS